MDDRPRIAQAGVSSPDSFAKNLARSRKHSEDASTAFKKYGIRYEPTEPLTRINGAELLTYLKEMGYAARIELEEAMRLHRLIDGNGN